jgi:acetyl-CoA carboxylase carboxyl transferase subunit alpha
VRRIFDDFQELHGDRAFADDPAIVGGVARLDGRAVVVIGHQKGRDTKEKIQRNFGMPRPGGLSQGAAADAARRALRPADLHLHRHPGAYPGVGAEERGQSEAIARNLQVMAGCGCPSSPPSPARAAPAARWPSASATG